VTDAGWEAVKMSLCALTVIVAVVLMGSYAIVKVALTGRPFLTKREQEPDRESRIVRPGFGSER
jgi:hypothetical protein